MTKKTANRRIREAEARVPKVILSVFKNLQKKITSDVDELGGRCLEGGHREASEHNRRREEGRQNDRGVDSDNSLEEGTHADS